MKERIKSFFTENILLKLSALIIGFLLWLAGMNLNNPKKIETYEVPLLIKNEEKLLDANRILLNKESLENMRVDVRIRGTVFELQNFEESSLEAYVDLGLIENLSSDLSGRPIPTTIFVNAKFPYEVVGNHPSTVDVFIERKIAIEKEIVAKFEHEAMEGYAALNPVVTPEKVKISGASSTINSIKSVEMLVDIADRDESFDMEAKLVVYDSEGTDITNRVTLSFDMATVHTSVYKIAAIPIVFSVEFTGSPASGYVVTKQEANPMEVEIIGDPKDIENFKKIQLNPFDVTGLDKDLVLEVDIRNYLPATLSMADPTKNLVNIHIQVEEKAVKTVKIPTDKILVGFEETPVSYAFEREEIEISITGAKSFLEEFNVDDLILGIELMPREPGIYELEVGISLPKEIELVGPNPRILVRYLAEAVESEVDEEAADPATS